MKKYIEREAACAYNPPEKKERRYSTYNLDDAFENGYDEHIKQVEAIPTADVVEVVRCKECMFYEPFRERDGFCRIDGMLWNESCYCSYGELKDGADDDHNEMGQNCTIAKTM